MAQTENKEIYRIDKHKDTILTNNPDHQASFEKRNKQLRKIFEACGYQIGGISVSSSDMLTIKFGKHYTFRALSTDRYIILLDSYDYKASKIKVQLVTETDLKINKIKPKIEELMKNVMERLSLFVTKEEHKERDEALKDAIIEELGGKESNYHGWTNYGKDNDEMAFTYNIEIGELRNDNVYHKEGEKRTMGVYFVMKIERYPTEIDNYDIKNIDTPTISLSGGSHLCLNDDIEFHNEGYTESIFKERLSTVEKRVNILMGHAIIIKKAVVKVLMELENYEINFKPSSPTKEEK